MNVLFSLVKRNIKLFFKDKGMFFTSLATPLILLVLYSGFLGNVYYSSFNESMPSHLEVGKNIIEGLVKGELLSSLLAVCCVTVAFSSNLLMVQDKVTKARDDLNMSPLHPSILACSYAIATFIVTLLICYVAALAGFGYMASSGWYLGLRDVVLILFDIFLLVLFGTFLSSVIHHFLSTQGQMSAVSTIISAGYGFICGAYMPISNFSEGLQKFLMFLPGTYGTSLIRNHTMGRAFEEMKKLSLPNELIEALKDGVDCNLYFFDKKVEISEMYLIVLLSIVVLISIYMFINYLSLKKTKR